MPDTGAPWNIPYVESTDLVSDWPTDSLALANAIDSGLDAAGGLVAVKHALFTGTQTNSTASGGSFDITDLSITHEVADASNKLIFSAFIGAVANTEQQARVGLGVHDGTSFVGVATGTGNRTAVTAAGTTGSGNAFTALSPSATLVHTPGSGSKTYTLRAINVSGGTHTVYINRTETDNDVAGRIRAVAGLMLMEVKV